MGRGLIYIFTFSRRIWHQTQIFCPKDTVSVQKQVIRSRGGITCLNSKFFFRFPRAADGYRQPVQQGSATPVLVSHCPATFGCVEHMNYLLGISDRFTKPYLITIYLFQVCWSRISFNKMQKVALEGWSFTLLLYSSDYSVSGDSLSEDTLLLFNSLIRRMLRFVSNNLFIKKKKKELFFAL